MPVFFGGLLALWVVLIYEMNLSQPLPLYAKIVLGLITVLFGCIALVWLRPLRANGKSRCALVFGPAEVTYLEEAVPTGEVTHRTSIPLAEWYGLSYAFDATGQENETVLLLTKAAQQQYQQQQRADLSFKEGVKLLLEKNQAQALYFKRFNPTQRLALVNWARAETERRLAASAGI